MTKKRHWLACVCLTAATYLAVAPEPVAAADHTYHPLWYTRLAVTDQSTATGMQPWVWAVTAGDTSGVPFLLTAKNADATGTSSWLFTFSFNLTSAPDAVSWADGSTPRQRVFFSADGTVQMMDWDNNQLNSVVSLPGTSTFTFPVGDVAALTWTASGVRRLGVASYAAKNGVNGFLCFWEKAVSDTTWSKSCTTSAVLPGNTTVPDIAGVVHTTIGGTQTPLFFFRNAANRLGRARRTTTAAYTVDDFGTQSISPSVFATPSQTAGSVDVGMIGADNRVWIARLSSASSLLPGWTTLPALPSSALPNFASNVSLSGASYPISSTNSRTEVAVINTAGRLHLIHTTNDTGTAWDAAWSAAAVPGNGGTTAPEQVVSAIGPTTGNLLGNGARMFMVAGGAVGAEWATTLQEYRSSTTRPFVDHVRFNWSAAPALQPSSTGATESAIAAGPVLGVAAAISRANPVPWGTWIANTTDNGSSFGSTFGLVARGGFGANRSLSDPTLAHGGAGGHLLHMATLEVSRQTVSQFVCGPTMPEAADAITYRRGFSGSELSGSSFLVTSGNFDHPALGVTVNASDQATAHVLVWDETTPTTADRTMYWTLAPGDVISGPHNVTAALPAFPAGVVTGANQTVAYGWTGDWAIDNFTVPAANASLFPTVCRMNGSSTALTCGKVGGSVSPARLPATVDLPFGAAQSGSPAGTCDVGGTRYKCFNVWQPVSMAADQVTANRLYAAYQAIVPGSSPARLGIYFTRNTDNALTTWATPIEIDAGAAGFHLINPAVTIDYRGTIVVTYSRIRFATATTPTDGRADVLMRHSSTGITFSTAEQIISSWDADNLPFHCGRDRYFYGEYHHGDVVANRAMHIVPNSQSSVMRQYAMWFSSNYNLGP